MLIFSIVLVLSLEGDLLHSFFLENVTISNLRIIGENMIVKGNSTEILILNRSDFKIKHRIDTGSEISYLDANSKYVVSSHNNTISLWELVYGIKVVVK